MSCYETHKGIIKKVDLQGKSIKEFILDHASEDTKKNEFFKKYLDSLDDSASVENQSEVVDDLLYYLGQYKYFRISNVIYEWLQHERIWDEIDSFCILDKQEDGSYKVFSQFYNGGTYIEEMIEDEFDEMKK